MISRFWTLALCAVGLVLSIVWLAGARADTAQEARIVRFDATSARTDRASEIDEAVSPLTFAWESWTSEGATIHDLAADETYRMENWTNRADHAGLEFVNRSRSLVRLRVVVNLPAGLWRADGVVVPEEKAGDGMGVTLSPENQASAPWRMESLLLTTSADTSKTFEVRAGASLFLRWTETGASALAARKAVRRACWTTADRALQDRVAGALMPVDDIIDALPTLIAHGDRKKITTRIHTALLATAKAQALWDNGRGEGSTDRDTAFTYLTVALSEVSCAAFDLVPSQKIVLSPTTGNPELLVGVTNAGNRTIPLVTLGIENADGTAPVSDRNVYRSVPPGATVYARFPLSDPAAHGVIQFISDMGAATVSAAPNAPPPAAIGGD